MFTACLQVPFNAPQRKEVLHLLSWKTTKFATSWAAVYGYMLHYGRCHNGTTSRNFHDLLFRSSRIINKAVTFKLILDVICRKGWWFLHSFLNGFPDFYQLSIETRQFCPFCCWMHSQRRGPFVGWPFYAQHPPNFMLWLRKPVKELGGGSLRGAKFSWNILWQSSLLQQHKLRPLAKTCCATSGVIVHTKGREIEEGATERKRDRKKIWEIY